VLAMLNLINACPCYWLSGMLAMENFTFSNWYSLSDILCTVISLNYLILIYSPKYMLILSFKLYYFCVYGNYCHNLHFYWWKQVQHYCISTKRYKTTYLSKKKELPILPMKESKLEILKTKQENPNIPLH